MTIRIAAIVAASLCAGTALAQESIYDVKAVCGKGDGRIVAEGQYFTAINILNPNDETVKVEGRVAVALPGLTMGPLSGSVSAELRPNHAMELDCPEMLKLAEGRDFLKGYAILRGSAPLVVVAVYTQADREGSAVSIDVERVPPRRGEGGGGGGCTGPDLIIKEIFDPEWDSTERQSVIRATVANVGAGDAANSIARVMDYSTTQPSGAPYNATANTGPIPAGGEVTVTFTLPYWVFNPDAELEVTADYKGLVKECNEDNNVLDYFKQG